MIIACHIWEEDGKDWGTSVSGKKGMAPITNFEVHLHVFQGQCTKGRLWPYKNTLKYKGTFKVSLKAKSEVLASVG